MDCDININILSKTAVLSMAGIVQTTNDTLEWATNKRNSSRNICKLDCPVILNVF